MWQQVDYNTKKLRLSGGDAEAVPHLPGEMMVSGLSFAGFWEAAVSALNTVGWSALSPVSNAVAVRSPMAPPAPSAPLLEAVGQGQLRVRWAAPPAEPPCTAVTIHLRQGGSSVWQQVDYNTKKLMLSGDVGLSAPPLPGEMVVSGLSAGFWEVAVSAYNTVGWGAMSPSCLSACTILENDDDDDGVAVVGSLSWAERDQALRKRAIDLDDAELQDTKQVQKRHKSRVGARCVAKSE